MCFRWEKLTALELLDSLGVSPFLFAMNPKQQCAVDKYECILSIDDKQKFRADKIEIM